MPKGGLRCMSYNSHCPRGVSCSSSSRAIHPGEIKVKKRSLGGIQFQVVIYAIKFLVNSLWLLWEMITFATEILRPLKLPVSSSPCAFIAPCKIQNVQRQQFSGQCNMGFIKFFFFFLLNSHVLHVIRCMIKCHLLPNWDLLFSGQ